MLTYSNKYSINPGNYFYEPIRYQNNLHRNYYYYSSATNENRSNNRNKNINYYSYIKKDKNYFNSRTTNSCYNNIYENELNDINNYNFDFSKKNINFNCASNKKIKLTYEFENISPNEISNKTKELIDLQSQMCTLDNDMEKSNRTNTNKNRNKGNNKKLSRSQKSINSNLLSSINTYKTSYKLIKRNSTFNKLINSENRFNNSSNKNRIKRSYSVNKSINKSMIKIWKDKCKALDKDILNVKNNIKKVKNINIVINKRINEVKEKEDKKYDIYDKNYKIKKYNKKLEEKLNLSEEIKKKQIELIIKMQKEVNNMRLKLHMLGECCM
jgi:hypothetical protein